MQTVERGTSRAMGRGRSQLDRFIATLDLRYSQSETVQMRYLCAHLWADWLNHEHCHFGYLQLRFTCERYVLLFNLSCYMPSGNLYTITLRKV